MSVNTSPPSTSTKLVAEALGTFLLVFGGVGTALFAANFPADAADNPLGVGFVGVSLAFGLTVVAGAYAWGPISGGHFNPAITLGLAASGRFEWRNTIGYIVAQVIGGAIATTLLVLIGLFGPPDWLSSAQDGGFASNGYGSGAFGSPGGFGIGAAIIAEVLLTAIFVLVILGVTHTNRGTAALAPLAIGLTLTLIHLILIPIDNASVNPARSIATAIYGGPDALLQLWVFIVFPIVGGLLAGVLHRALFEPKGVLPPDRAEARVR